MNRKFLLAIILLLLFFVSSVHAENKDISCIKVVEETYGFPIWNATITITVDNGSYSYVTDEYGKSEKVSSLSDLFDTLGYNSSSKIKKIKVEKKGYYLYYSSAPNSVYVADEKIPETRYLIEENCLVIKLKSIVKLEILFPPTFNVSVSIDGVSIGYTDIHTEYKFGNNENFTWAFKGNTLLVVGLTPGSHTFNFTPKSPAGYKEASKIYTLNEGDNIIHFNFEHEENKPWDILSDHLRNIIIGTQVIVGTSSDNSATDAALAEFFSKLLPVLILTSSLWLFISSHIFKEKRYKDLGRTFIVVSTFFVLSICIDIIAILLNSIGRTYYWNSFLLFCLLTCYIIGWVLAFDFIWGMRKLFTLGPLPYITFFGDMVSRTPTKFINDIRQMYHRKKDKFYIFILMVFLMCLVLLFYPKLIKWALYLWMMVTLLGVISGVLRIERLNLNIFAMNIFVIQTRPYLLHIVVIPAMFSSIIFGIIFGISIFLSFLSLSLKIDIVNITMIIFAVSFWTVFIKTLFDILLFVPEKPLKRPEEFMKNHEDPNLLYFYNRKDALPCKRGDTIFCIADSGTHPYELLNQFILDGLRNGEYCIYIFSTRDIGTIIKKLFEQKKEIEDKMLELNDPNYPDKEEMNRFKETMKICHHGDHLKRILKEIVMRELEELKEEKIEGFISQVGSIYQIEDKDEFVNTLKFEAKHREAEKTLKERDLTKLKDFILKYLVEKMGKKEEIVDKLDTEFGIEKNEAEKMVNAVIFEVKYEAF